MDDHDTITRLLGGRYLVGKEIGHGGAATVFKGLDVRTERPVAIKILREDRVGSRKMQLRFLREAKLIASLKNPHVLRIYDYGAEHSRPYMVLEYISGGSVLAWLKKAGAVHQRAALFIIFQAILGLDSAHQKGIVHRDLKTSNLLVRKPGQYVVADFGIALAQDAERLTRTAAAFGSIGFMSPEQRMDAHRVGPQSDFFALGAVLYRLLTRKAPPDLSLSAYEPGLLASVPSPCREVVLMATRHVPEDRYECARHMAQAVADARDEVALEAQDCVGGHWMARFDQLRG